MANQAKPSAPKGKILPDLSKKENQVSAEQKAKPVRKKGNRVSVEFIGANGIGAASPGEDVVGVRVKATETNTTFTLNIGEIAQNFPKLAFQLMAFGASVHLRNACNTAEDAESAAEALEARFNAFTSGSYRASGRSAGTPLALRALAIVLERKGIEEGKRERTLAALLDEYRGGKVDTSAMDDEAAEKAIAKARRETISKISRVPGVEEAMAELRKPKEVEAIEVDDILVA